MCLTEDMRKLTCIGWSVHTLMDQRRTTGRSMFLSLLEMVGGVGTWCVGQSCSSMVSCTHRTTSSNPRRMKWWDMTDEQCGQVAWCSSQLSTHYWHPTMRPQHSATISAVAVPLQISHWNGWYMFALKFTRRWMLETFWEMSSSLASMEDVSWQGRFPDGCKSELEESESSPVKSILAFPTLLVDFPVSLS